MGRLSIPISEHNKIRRSLPIQAELRKLAAEIADEAASRIDWDRERRPSDAKEDNRPPYGIDLVVGSDRARAHVWPQTGEAVNAEAHHAPLLQIAAERGR